MTLTQVNSAGIADGAIVNADINNSAAVALSKLATSGTASSSNYLRGDGAWSAIDLSTKLNLTGGTLTGNVIHNDDVKALFGTGSDLEIFHDGTQSKITESGTGLLYINSNVTAIKNSAGNENQITAEANGSVGLYYDNVKHFETISGGIRVKGAEGGNGSIELYADEGDDNADKRRFLIDTNGDFYIANYADGAWETDIMVYQSEVRLYYDNSIKLQTDTYGITVNGRIDATGTVDSNELSINGTVVLNSSRSLYNLGVLELADNIEARFGSGNDLKIYHDGSNSYLDNDTGNLFIRNDTGGGGIYLRVNQTEAAIAANKNGSVELYYDNSKKLDTNSGGVKIHGNLDVDDNNKLRVGTSSDLQIYHDGTDNIILSSGASCDLLTYVANGELAVKAVANGQVELYYDNSKKFETYSNGVQISGRLDVSDYINITGGADLYLADNGKANFGNSTDLEIYHDGSDSYIKDDGTGSLKLLSHDFQLKNAANSETMIRAYENGSVELYYDNSKKFHTQSWGAELVSGQLHIDSGCSFKVADSVEIQVGNSADLKIYHDGSNSYIKDTGTGNLVLATSELSVNNAASNEEMIKASQNGAVELFYDNSKKLETQPLGVNITGNLDLVDNDKIRLGTASDLQIFHDGSNSYINHGGTGSLYVQSNSSGDDLQLWSMDDIYIRPQGGEEGVKVVGNAHVSLYYDNSQKFYTQSDKCVVAGHFYPESTNSYDLGHPSYRWNNIYVNDMHFSNEGSTNSVDGTWGDWTLQEGDENIFMINNRTGKKYKMGLMEVS